MVHKASRVPCWFGAFWHDVVPKRPNRLVLNGPEFGGLMLTGRFRPVDGHVGLTITEIIFSISGCGRQVVI
jgi:hypothetical protein